MMTLPKVDVIFYWYDDVLLFKPLLPQLEKAVTISEKKFVKQPRRAPEIRYQKRSFISMVSRNGEQVASTYQGFLHTLVQTCIKNNITFFIRDMRTAQESRGFPAPRLDLMQGFRHSQEALLTEALSKGQSGLIGAPTRYGKCLGIDTKLLTADYDIVKVQDVKVGDKLMGPDGAARTVAALGRGREQSYRIVPNKGEPFTCNESHILPLKVTGGAKMGGWKKGDIVFVTVKEYLGKSKTFKHITKLWYAALDFQEAQLPVDPWVVGVWIGDGRFNGGSRLTKPDTAVQTGLIAWAEGNGYTWEYRDDNGKEHQALKINTTDKTVKGRYCSAFRQIADMCCVDEEKRIPKKYLTASRRQRLELLAGLIDTDGYNVNNMGYEIVTKYDGLSEDIIRLCRGLGFRVTRTRKVSTIKALGFSGEYWRMQISGPLPEIPCRSHKHVDSVKRRVDPTLTGFTIEDIGEQDYYGIAVDGTDKMFLLWDHLVTHNTALMVNTIRAFPTLPTVVTAPGVDLCRQLFDDITGEWGIKDREVKLICSGSKTRYPSETGITICSADSLSKCDSGGTQLLLADEPHQLVTATRAEMINAFTVARRYGFGATLKGRFDGRDPLITGLFGPVLAERTYLDAVEEGAICPLCIIFININISDTSRCSTHNAAYKKLLFQNADMAGVTARICHEIVPDDFQTMIFIDNEKQANLYFDKIGHEGSIVLAMAKKMTDKEREQITEDMRNGTIKRCLCTDIYVQGVTFPDVRVLINCEGGGNNTSAIQKPGRLAQVRPGKKCGVIFDFAFHCLSSHPECAHDLERDSAARRVAYKEKGYTIYDAYSMEEAKQIFDSII